MIPSRTEAAAVLLDLSPSPRLLRHATAVAEVAAFLAEHIERRGLPVDRRLVESAALLHDLDKALPRNDPLPRPGTRARRRALAHRARLRGAGAGRRRPPGGATLGLGLPRLGEDGFDRGPRGGLRGQARRAAAGAHRRALRALVRAPPGVPRGPAAGAATGRAARERGVCGGRCRPDRGRATALGARGPRPGRAGGYGRAGDDAGLRRAPSGRSTTGGLSTPRGRPSDERPGRLLPW